MQPSELIRRLYELGHFRNPAHPTGVNEDDLPNLRLTDEPVKKAIASYQEFMAEDFDRLSLAAHGRIGIADGEVGPATEALVQVERCGCPDYDGAEMATGSGSWPAGCHPDWPNNHAFTVQVNKSGMPSFLGRPDDPNSIFEQAWDLQRRAYADIGIVFIREDDNPRANTYVTWQRGAGWIGLAIVPNRPKCGERIWAKFDNRYSPGAMLDQWARLLAHEFGHNMGMSHSRGGIMNPSITSGKFTTTAWRGDPSESLLSRFFGGEPVDLGDGPKPPPKPDDPNPPEPPKPPGPNEYWFKGSFELMRGDESLGPYILAPKPQV